MTPEIKKIYTASRKNLLEFEKKIKPLIDNLPKQSTSQVQIEIVVREYFNHSLSTMFVFNDFLFQLAECEDGSDLEILFAEMGVGNES